MKCFDLLPQMLVERPAFGGLDEADGGGGGGGGGGNRRGAEYEAARAVHKKINECARAANVAAAGAERLAERAHLDVNFAGHAKGVRKAAPIFADDAGGRRYFPDAAIVIVGDVQVARAV